MLKALICPRCGGNVLLRTSFGTLKCGHCETILVEEKDGFLAINAQGCPSCGFINIQGASYCGNCGQSAKRWCFYCRLGIPIGSIFCPSCGGQIDFRGLTLDEWVKTVTKSIRERFGEDRVTLLFGKTASPYDYDAVYEKSRRKIGGIVVPEFLHYAAVLSEGPSDKRFGVIFWEHSGAILNYDAICAFISEEHRRVIICVIGSRISPAEVKKVLQEVISFSE